MERARCFDFCCFRGFAGNAHLHSSSNIADTAAGHEAAACQPTTAAPSPANGGRRQRLLGLSPLARASKKSTEAEIQAVFNEMDPSGSGSVSLEQSRSYLGDYLGYGQVEMQAFFDRHAARDGHGLELQGLKEGYADLNPLFIAKRKGEVLVRKPGSLGGQQVNLDELEDCEVYVCDLSGQAFVDFCKRSLILVGPCQGAISIRDCEDCTFWCAAQQIRIKNCRSCTFHLYAKTEPTIVSSAGLTFAPWSASYPRCEEHFAAAGFAPEKNLWNAIFDFSGEQETCHWCIPPLDDIVELHLELDEPPSEACSPMSPCPAPTHAMLCTAPLASEDASKQNAPGIPQTRPPLPAVPARPSGTLKLSVRDERVVRQPGAHALNNARTLRQQRLVLDIVKQAAVT